MAELGELEKQHADFERTNLRVIVVSIEDQDLVKKTQADLPHLIVASDKERKLSNAVEVIHVQSGPEGTDTSAPTTILIDREGSVRWLFRPGHVFTRLSPSELVEKAGEFLAIQKS
jgi:peroxiredoxin